jgi:integrase
MVQAGASIFDVSKVLGHASVTVTMRYAHFAPDASRDAVSRLGRALDLGGLPTGSGAAVAR